MHKINLADNLFLVRRLLDPTECAALIDRAEAIGFTPAAIRTKGGPQMHPTIRDNERVAITDSELAESLWKACLPFVPIDLEGGTAEGLDDYWRFYRYDIGQRFRPHRDGVTQRSSTVRSRLTCLFYLNSNFEGGHTVFYPDRTPTGTAAEPVVVVPQAGDALFFRHEWLHEGRAPESGRKYVLRSDVFYRFPTRD